MAKAIRIHETGGPEVLKYEEVETPAPAAGEVLIRQNAVGLNFIDIYFRTGLYPARPPFTPGGEGAGVISSVGEGVTQFKEGDRVAYVTNGGAYAQERLMPADRVVKIPDGVSDEQAAAIMLKGITAWYLLRRTFPVEKGHRILYHAAAGGVGLILGQWAKHLGAQTIGTAGGEEKVKLALQHGYDSVIDYKTENFVEKVAALTDGKKCDVVYDSVGKDTFEGSLDCLRPLGMFVSFGQSSGQVPPFSINLLAQKGSIFTTRPTLFTYVAERKELETAADELFGLVKDGVITPKINQRYPLADAGRAHDDLENRRTSGATVLLP